LTIAIVVVSICRFRPKKTFTTTIASKRDGTLLDSEKAPYEGNSNSNTNNRNDIESVRGRVLRRQTTSSSPTLSSEESNAQSTPNVATTTMSRKREATISPDSSNSNKIAGNSTNEFESTNNNKSKKSRKTVTFDGKTDVNATPANSESDNSKRSRTAAQLAREQRSRRRQAAQSIDGSDHIVVAATQRKADNRINHKKKSLGSTSKNSTEVDTNVVRVPMLTGTLILYRGAHPRAVFVRRV
jgi:hypothetical protein